jgi:hypothetical protein
MNFSLILFLKTLLKIFIVEKHLSADASWRPTKLTPTLEVDTPKENKDASFFDKEIFVI